MRNLDNDNDLQNYLREFQPVAPRPLPLVRKRVPLIWAALSAAILLALAVIVMRGPWQRRPSTETRQHLKPQPAVGSAPVDSLTVGKLSAAAQKGDQALESELARSAFVALPRMDRPNTALNVLSGE